MNDGIYDQQDEVYLRQFVPLITKHSPRILQHGEIILCTRGKAEITVNYKDWILPEGGVIFFFPNDMVALRSFTPDYEAKILGFSSGILREASLDLEHIVYSTLREDRCRGGTAEITQIVGNIFALLECYFGLKNCHCLEKLVLLQLKSLFLHSSDYFSNRYKIDESAYYGGSRRKSEVFASFMQALEREHKRNREVSFYASLQHITPKYLNTISKSVSGCSAKQVIDNYVILKLKQDLMEVDKQVKQIAWDYNFSDSSFFTRYFKLHTGMTPQAFRQEGRPR